MRSRCMAVSFRGFRLVGDTILDLSPRGMLVECEDDVRVGESLRVTFEAPRSSGWFQVDAEVARLVKGHRRGDPGHCAGLRFTSMHYGSRGSLLASLAGLPPPVPARPLRMDYAATIEKIARRGIVITSEPPLRSEALARWSLLG